MSLALRVVSFLLLGVSFVWLFFPDEQLFEPLIGFVAGVVGLGGDYVTRSRDRVREEQQGRIEQAHARSIELSVGREDDRVSLWVSNVGTHEVTDVEISAIPDDEEWAESSHGSPPSLVSGGADVVELCCPMMGGWFLARIAKLTPERGVLVAQFRVTNESFTKADFDVSWIDHTGQKRKSHGVADVRQVEHSVELSPRPPRSASG